MHDFTTFEHTIPVYGDSDPMRKHIKKFRCAACNKDKFHIPLTTVDGRTVCIHCCMTGSGQNIVLDNKTIDALEAAINRINGIDNYPPKEKLDWKAFKRELYWKYVFPDLAPIIAIGLSCFGALLIRPFFA